MSIVIAMGLMPFNSFHSCFDWTFWGCCFLPGGSRTLCPSGSELLQRENSRGLYRRNDHSLKAFGLLGLWMCMKISIWNMVSTVAPQRQSIWCDRLLNPIGRPSTSEKKGTARKPNDTDWIQNYLIKVNSWPFVKTCWKLYRDPLCHGFHTSTVALNRSLDKTPHSEGGCRNKD